MPLDDINKLGALQDTKETDSLTEQLQKLQKMFEDVSLFYVKKVAEQINAIGEMNPTSINRMNIMTAVNEDISQIKQVLKNTIKQSIGPLKDVLQTALREDWETENFKRLLDKHPLGEPQKKQLNKMTEMIARQTYGAMENLSNTTAIDRQYRKLVDRAVLGVTSGMGSYTEAVRDGIKELGHAGMQVEYASGYHRRLDSAIMQNITNAAKQISQQGADLCREQMGTDAVELSAHVSPAPDHEPVQGRVFLNAEFAKMQSQQDFIDITGKHYKGFRRPIGEWNCMHIANPFDTETSVRTWTDKDLQDMINANAKGFTWNGKHYTMYQGRQLMRRIETQIRREKDTAIAARTVGDSVLEKQCKDRISALEKRYADLCKTAELPPQWDRTIVDQFKRRTETSKENSGYGSWSSGTNKVDLEYIKTDDFKAKFKGLSGNPKVDQSLYSKAKAMLTHRNGTDFEDSYIVNAKTGHVVLSNTSSRKGLEVSYSKSKIDAAKANNPEGLIGIHNHPTNLPPSGSDFGAAGYRRYKFGLVVCHNGDVYFYKTGNRPFSSQALDMKIDSCISEFYKDRQPNYIFSGYEKALNSYVDQFGIEWRKL